MKNNKLLGAVVILTCICCVQSQYYDFFQAFQSFIQPQPSQPLNFLNDFTTRRTRPKQKGIDENVRKLDKISITDVNLDGNRRVSEQDKNKATRRKPFDITTQRSIRKTTRNPSNQSKSQILPNQRGSSAIVYLDDSRRPNNGGTGSKNTDSVDKFDRERPKASRPIHKQTQVTNAPNWNAKSQFNYYTTRPYYETTKSFIQNNNKKNYATTHNPLLNRPGVRPAVVNGPPITNRPVTNRPVTHRPDFQRPQDIDIDDDLRVTPEVISGPDEDYMSAVERKRYVEIAERMCDKYKGLNTKLVEAIPLVPSPQPVRVNVSSCPPTTIPLVVGGKVVGIQEFPHMALLGWKKIKGRGYSWKCGGSLLSNQFILTAGHCAYQDRDDNVIAGPPRVVQLGSSYLNDPKAVFVKVSAVTRHPKYKLPKAYYDLAIVKMAATVTFSDKIKPACLGTPPAPNRPIIATGWGKTEFGGSQSEELRSVSIPVWDIAECGKALGVSVKIPFGPSSDSQICAGDRQGGKDTCQGDSGGPAQVQDGCTWRVVAVTSVGRFCGAAETPAIYAIVQHAFISAVVFSKEATQYIKETNDNNNRNNQPSNNNSWNNQATNNNRYNQTTNSNNNWNNQATNNNNGWNNNRNQASNSNNDWNNNNQANNNWNSNNNRNDQTNSNWNNNRGSQVNNQGNANWNNKRTTEQTYNTQQQNNRQNNMNQWNKDSNSGTTSTYSYNRDEIYNWNQDYSNKQQYPTNNYNSQNQPVRNEYGNNYNTYTTENYSISNSRRENEYYIPQSRETENSGGEYYNNYAGSKNYRGEYSRQQDYANGRSDTYEGNVWWT